LLHPSNLRRELSYPRPNRLTNRTRGINGVQNCLPRAFQAAAHIVRQLADWHDKSRKGQSLVMCMRDWKGYSVVTS
jgi:hypothetical protein